MREALPPGSALSAATMPPPMQQNQPHHRRRSPPRRGRRRARCERSSTKAKPKSFKTYSLRPDPEVYFWTIDHVLYGLARPPRIRRTSSASGRAGCAGGEEPYSLAIAWRAVLAERFPAVRLEIVATDVDDMSLRRAKAGVFDVARRREPAGRVGRHLLPAPRRRPLRTGGGD